MRMLSFAILMTCLALGAHAQQPPRAEARGGDRPAAYQAPPVLTLEARQLREFKAQEARQGVAVDAEHFYAVVNTTIGKYDKQTGAFVSRWSGPRGGLIAHLNSCFAEVGALLCANSNFPQVPMASSIEIFDSAAMTHKSTRSLGILDEGSLTFFDRLGDGWIAGFAHYDGEGGLAYKDAAFAGVVIYDANWRRTGGYALPKSVQERMAPHAASGGALGPDGLLYLFGHDLPELYVVAKPAMGPTLIHVATIAVDAAGQAFAWDKSDPRTLYAINRPSGTVRVFQIPDVALDHSPNARRFVAE